jgi:uncharacterized protein YktA (UPF0223 family)
MKKTLQITEQEKKEILEQHNLFKEVLKSKSKVKRLMVNEQATPTSGGGVEFLKAARDKGCQVAKGGVLRSAPGKPTVLYKKADFNDDNGQFKIGDELYIKDNFTLDVVITDADGKRTMAYNKTWACPALTKPVEDQIRGNITKTKLEGNWKTKEDVLAIDTEQNIENPKMYEKKVVNGTTLYRNLSDVGINKALTKKGQDVLTYYTNNGALLQSQVDPEQSQTYTKIKIGSNPDFSEDFYVYLDPTKVTDPKMLADIQANINKTIPQDKKICKKAIEDYYTNFKKKRVVLPNELTKMKADVQSCKNEFYKDWGFFGSKKIDDMLDVMSGGVGGPSRMGDDAKWRLN